jgi:hypothetical protein
MTAITLRAFARADLATVEPWFRDPDTQRYPGGPQWPAAMLDLGEPAIGTEFRGAVQTSAHRYLASIDGEAFGYVDCGRFDRHVVYGGEGPVGPTVIATDDLVTGAIAFTVAPGHCPAWPRARDDRGADAAAGLGWRRSVRSRRRTRQRRLSTLPRSGWLRAALAGP